ncbi:hypothetical protein V7S57_02495 [Caulobacter sp. CCNWLY153]|uniref:hypothetical protein n=1 Tax=unclassified Caulobacter TaxID=2648921 RepID=UPI002FEF57ED
MLTVNAKRAGPRAVLDCAGGVFSRGDRSFASLMAVRGLQLQSSGGVALTPRGRLVPFADGAPKLVAGEGLALEPAARNKCTAMGAAPVNASGWTKSTTAPSTVTITVVDDTAALYAAQDPVSGEYIFRGLMDAGLMNGKVYRFYNPTSEPWYVSVPGTASATGPHSIAAYVRCISGQGDIRVFSVATAEAFSGTHWRRTVRSNLNITTGASRLTVAAYANSEVYVILPDFQDVPVITSPIITAGAAVTRSADALRLGFADALTPPFTALMDVHIDRADAAVRRMLTVAGDGGAEVAITRTANNALTTVQTNGALSPFIPRCFGPGSVRMALRVRRRGRTLGFGQALAHDPFPLPVERMKSIWVGQSAGGAEKSALWLRSLRILGDLDDDQLRARTLPAPDGVALDIFRYIDPAGNDANDGKTPATAWASLAKGADSTVPGGGHVLLKRGGVWAGGLLVKSNCTYSAYGAGAKPKFGAGAEFAVDENSASAVRVEGLHMDGATKMGVNLFGGTTTYQFGGWQIVDNEISHIGVAAGPDYQGISIRYTRNVYLARNYIHNVYGDCVWNQSVRGLVLEEDGHYDTPLGSAADCWQASTCEAVVIRRPVMNMRTQATDSGKGALVVQATSLVLEDFDIRGLNFGVGLNCSKAQVRRGVIRNGDQQSYSWGIGITESANVRDHLWEDILIEDCNRGVALSGIGGGAGIGPTRIDVLARRIHVRRCGVGLRIDRPTSGDFTGVTFEDCPIEEQRVAGLIVPTGGWYTTLKT